MLRYNDRGNDLPIIPLQNYAEVAKVAAKTDYKALKYVKGSVDIYSGRQLFSPINGYNDIAEAFVHEDGMALMWVPGSGRRQSQIWTKPIDGYKELVKLALNTAYHSYVFVPDDIMYNEEMQRAWRKSMADSCEARAIQRRDTHSLACSWAGAV